MRIRPQANGEGVVASTDVKGTTNGPSATTVTLVHGWGGSFATTWAQSGFTDLLADAGLGVIGVDLLGHGAAPKPHDPADYADLTARIVDALPDHPVAGVGFSLGALTLLRTAIDAPDRFERLVLAGVGTNVLAPTHDGVARILEGLDAARRGDDLDDLDTTVRLFVHYATRGDNDLEALTAVMRRPPGAPFTEAALARVECPVLVVVGDRDMVAPGDELAARFPDGRCVTLRNTDHFATPESFGFFDAALGFLGAST
jgi:pimeloyl-ACP methyl ester carboxylesterase